MRYVESGCYQGFMTYAAADILKEELGVERLNLLNVYTAADIRHRKTQGMLLLKYDSHKYWQILKACSSITLALERDIKPYL